MFAEVRRKDKILDDNGAKYLLENWYLLRFRAKQQENRNILLT